MGVLAWSYRHLFPDLLCEAGSGQDILDTETAAGEDFLVAAGMEVGKAVAELYFLSVDGDGAEGAFALGLCFGRQRIGVDAEEPADIGRLELEESGCAVVGVQVHGIAQDGSEDPEEHIEEMDTDIGGDAAGFGHLSFPTGVVPIASGGDVGEVYFFGAGALVHLLFEGH